MDVLIAYHGMARGSLDPTCGDRFTVSRALLCKGDFVAQRHDGIQNILTSLLSKVCKDVDVKLHLLPIDSEVFNLRSTVTSPEAILDIKAGSSGHEEKQHSSMYVERMWTQRVTRTNPQNRSSSSTRQEKELPTKSYWRGNGISPHPLVFGTNGGMGKECELFLSSLADKLPPPQNGKSYVSAISCFKTSTSFEIFTRRPHICSLWGSRSPFHKDANFLDDFSINAKNADIFN